MTNIGKDHSEFLGDDIKDIANEKAGIIKKEIPVVLSEYQKEVFSVFRDTAFNLNSKIYIANEESYEEYKTDLSRPLDRGVLGVELAGAKALVKGTEAATKGISNNALRSGIQRALNLGMTPAMAMRVARYASPLGIASLAGEGLYQVGKLGYEDQQRFNALSPEEQAAERAEQEKFAFDIEGS